MKHDRTDDGAEHRTDGSVDEVLAEARRRSERGEGAAGIALLDEALGARTAAEERAELRLLRGHLARQLGRLPDALRDAEEAMWLFDVAGLDARRARALLVAGHVYLTVGELARATERFTEAGDIARTAGDEALHADVARSLAMVFARTGDHDGARDRYNFALGIWRRRGDTQQEAACLNSLAVLRLREAETLPRGSRARAAAVDEARALLDEAIDLARAGGFDRVAAQALGNRAASSGLVGEPQQVLDGYDEALRLFEALGSRTDLCSARLPLGDALFALGRTEEAFASYRDGLAEAESQGLRTEQRDFHERLADRYEEAGDPAQALTHFRRFHDLDKALAAEQAHAHAEVATARVEMEQLRRGQEELLRAASEDPLTGIANRRALDRWLGRECGPRAGRSGTSALVAVALFDVDHFKRVNDEHSHAVGDEVLRAIAGLLRAEVRGDDLIARYGGEEFVLAMRVDTLDHAVEVAERARVAVAEHDWGDVAPGLRLTISAGVVAAAPPADPAALVVDADARLYEAKRAGRNRVVA